MVITSPDSSKDKLSVQIKGYEHQELPEEEEGKVLPYEFEEIANDIFRLLRGSTNLVFCNSRFTTESLAAKLESLSKKSLFQTSSSHTMALYLKN